MRTFPPQFEDLLTRDFLLLEYVQRHRAAQSIAQDVGVCRETVLHYLRRHGLPVRAVGQSNRRYRPPDVSGFEGPSTDWHAYWLGFIAADGCVYRGDRQHLLRVRLKAADAPHLENLRDGMRTDSPVHMENFGGYLSARLEVSGEPLTTVLAKWGIGARKSLRLVFPETLPGAMVPAFLRGYFDGNGTAYWRHRTPRDCRRLTRELVCRFVSGSPLFLEGVARRLQDHGIRTRTGWRNGTSNTNVLPLSSARENLVAFADLLYRGASVWLERKRTLFRELQGGAS